MPKKKKAASNSDSDTSDSGPDDPQPAKKSKTDSKPKESQKKSYDEEEPTWTLDSRRFLKIREFRGKLMVDIREYYEKDGDLRPGKKGISLSAMQWKKIVGYVDEIEEALRQKS